MQYAYRWPFRPQKEIRLQLLMTAISMLIAFGIGSVEWLQVISTAKGLKAGLVLAQPAGPHRPRHRIRGGLHGLWLVAMLVYKKVKPSGGTPPLSMGSDRLEAGVE